MKSWAQFRHGGTGRRSVLATAAAVMLTATIGGTPAFAATAPAQKPVQSYQYFVFSNPVAGQEAEYNRDEQKHVWLSTGFAGH